MKVSEKILKEISNIKLTVTNLINAVCEDEIYLSGEGLLYAVHQDETYISGESILYDHYNFKHLFDEELKSFLNFIDDIANKHDLYFPTNPYIDSALQDGLSILDCYEYGISETINFLELIKNESDIKSINEYSLLDYINNFKELLNGIKSI